MNVLINDVIQELVLEQAFLSLPYVTLSKKLYVLVFISYFSFDQLVYLHCCASTIRSDIIFRSMKFHNVK